MCHGHISKLELKPNLKRKFKFVVCFQKHEPPYYKVITTVCWLMFTPDSCNRYKPLFILSAAPSSFLFRFLSSSFFPRSCSCCETYSNNTEALAQRAYDSCVQELIRPLCGAFSHSSAVQCCFISIHSNSLFGAIISVHVFLCVHARTCCHSTRINKHQAWINPLVCLSCCAFVYEPQSN